MPMRKSHAKSRNGCSQCKSRRVKCDEQVPTCTRCLKRNEKCSLSESLSQSSSPLPAHSHAAGECCPRQHLELELMHQWMISTSDSVRHEASSAEFFTHRLPQTALTHDYLLDCMFSFTALHLASQNRSQASDYIAAAIGYRDRGMQRVAPAMKDPSEHHIIAIFWFSVLVGMVTMALTVVTSDASSKSFTSMLVNLGQLWRGTGIIASLASSLLGSDEEPTFTTMGRTPIADSSSTPLEPDIEEHLALLERLICAEDAVANSPMYLKSLELMREGFRTWVAQERMDGIMAWATELGNDFAMSLSSGNPVALLCTLVYGVCLSEVNNRWWAKGAGKALVHECSVALRGSPEGWWELISWARRRVGLGTAIPIAPQDL